MNARIASEQAAQLTTRPFAMCGKPTFTSQ